MPPKKNAKTSTNHKSRQLPLTKLFPSVKFNETTELGSSGVKRGSLKRQKAPRGEEEEVVNVQTLDRSKKQKKLVLSDPPPSDEEKASPSSSEEGEDINATFDQEISNDEEHDLAFPTEEQIQKVVVQPEKLSMCSYSFHN